MFGIYRGGRYNVTAHIKGNVHQQNLQTSRSLHHNWPLAQTTNPALSIEFEAEARWSMFVSKHNLAFMHSDHATKLFQKMFPDSEIAKAFACGRTKTTAIVKEALTPHFLEKTMQHMSKPFSISDTANVMKGVRSGVQKLIKDYDEQPYLYDVGCICHLADLILLSKLA